MTADKKAKILATLGPATRSRDDIRALWRPAPNLFRLNFSHGDYADHAQRFAWVREVEAELNYPIGVLMDLQGPKLRVGRFAAVPCNCSVGRPSPSTSATPPATSGGSTCRIRRSSMPWNRA